MVSPFRPSQNFGRNRNFGRKPIPKLFRSYTKSKSTFQDSSSSRPDQYANKALCLRSTYKHSLRHIFEGNMTTRSYGSSILLEKFWQLISMTIIIILGLLLRTNPPVSIQMTYLLISGILQIEKLAIYVFKHLLQMSCPLIHKRCS